MADKQFSFDNRVAFVVKGLYDTDGNGYLDANDFENMALKLTILEGKGQYDKAKHEHQKATMRGVWNEIAELADLNKDGQVQVDEFKAAVQKVLQGKKFEQFPNCFRESINRKFASIDVNGDNLMSLDEFRIDCVNRNAQSIEEIDGCWEKLLNEEDRKKGGLTLERYQQLWAEFIANPDPNCPGSRLFGPLPELA